MVKRKNGSPGHKNDKKKKRIMISSEKNAPVKAIIPKLEKEAALGAEDDDIIELKREDAIEMSEDEYDNEDSFFKTSFEGDSEDGEEEPEDGISLDGLEAEDDDDLMQDPAILTDSIYQENNEEDEGESGDEHVHGGNCCSSSKVDSVLTDIKVFEQTLFKDNGFFEYQCSLSEPPVNWVKMPFSQKLDSVTEGQNAFEWMIKGIPVSDFLTEMYGKKCVHVKRSNQYYYGSFFSTDSFMKMLDSNTCEFGKNINFATYVDGVRKTPNGKGRVTSNDAKKALKSKMSIQCINPQSFNQNIWYLCDILQEYFQCFVGANNYITPFGSSGFSPHHDEIEGFLLQLEGRKFWRVWAPSDADSMFPIYSSENFNEEQMKDRKPVFSGWLEQGDLLYIPRGYIHQAKTDDTHRSHHVTISVARQHTYIDMYRKIAPTVIETMASNFPLFRQNIPVDFMSQFGVADVIERDENAIKKNVANMITTASTTFGILCKDYIDSAFDQMSKDYMIQALPPKLTKSEKKHSVVNEKEAGIVPFVLTLKSGIRFIRKHTQRLLFDPHGGSYIIHRMNNPRTFDSPLEQTVCVPNDFCSLYEEIARVYPEYITIEKVISYAQVSKQPGLAFIQNLYNHGLILVTEKL